MKHLTLILTLLFFSQLLLATPYRFFNRITINDGLSSNNVYAIWQDKKGYMWIGTANGLQRFDGKYFQHFNIRLPKPLPALPVKQILEDKEGNMWLRYGEEYGVFNPANLSFKVVPFEKKENRYQGEKLWIDSRGNVYVILNRNKILGYDKTKGLFTERFNPIKINVDFHPNYIFEDSKSQMYWITGEEGINVYDPISDQVYHSLHNPLNLPYLEDPKIIKATGYYIDSKRNHHLHYWNPDQIFAAYNEKSGTFLPAAKSLFNTGSQYRELHHAFESKSGELWYYGLYGIFLYDPVKDRFDHINHLFPQLGQVYQIYEDREGDIWMATDEGIYHYTSKSPEVKYGFYKKKDPPHLFIEVKEIKLKNSIQYWIPSWGSGVLIVDEKLQEVSSIKVPTISPHAAEKNQVWSVTQDRITQLVWVGAQAGWLEIINPNTLERKFYNLPILQKSTIRSISQDLKGNMWLTTQRGDVIKYDALKPIVNDSFKLMHTFSGHAVSSMADNLNRVWVSSSNSGIYCLDADTGKILKHLDDAILSSNALSKMAYLNDSIFFFGNDLLNAYNFNSNENRILSYSEGLISNEILNIQTDLDGYLWVNTTKGICRYNYFTNSFTHYSKKDGFGLMENYGDGGTLTSQGNIIFAGYSSLVRFNPSQFNSSIKPDRPNLTGIKLFDNYLFVDSLNTDKKRTFSHDNNSLTFYFSTLNFINQDKLKYFHKLSGIDQEWRSSGQSNMAVYTLLPHGKYTLEYRSENEEGISSPIGAFIFQIDAPYYETWWFRMAIALVILAVLFIIYRLRINRILAVVNVRNRVARDLHDDMGSTLSTINILSAMAKTKLNVDPVKASEFISKISDNSQRMMEAMDDIVWSIKPQNDSMDKIIARMREFATNALEPKDITFSFEVDDEVYKVKLPMDARRDLFLIFKEAVNNLVKYSNTPKAIIHFYLQNGRLLMHVKDYGLGFDAAHADTGNGLSNMQKRAENMKAKLNIISKHLEGTDVMLAIDI